MPGKLSLGIGVCAALLLMRPALAAGWTVDDTISALDGSRSYNAILQSTDMIRTPAGVDEPVTLVVRCTASRLEAYIAWPQQIGSGALDIRWKTDGGNYATEVWSVSRDGSATFSENARAFLASLRTAHRATFQLALVNFDTLEANFNVAGADAIANAAQSACPAAR